MSDKNDKPIQLSGPGWRTLGNGTLELFVHCESEADYQGLPDTLILRGRPLAKTYWSPSESLVVYRSGWDTIEEAMKNLM